MTKRIFVIGASRGVGGLCVEQALDRGWTVHAMARGPVNGGDPHPRLLVIAGDCRNETLLGEGVMGVDAVISVIGTPPSLSRVTIFSEHMAALLPVMQRAAIRRLIFVTGMGAGDSYGRSNPLYDYVFWPLVLRQMYLDKNRAEDLVQASDRDWTIVRPGLLTNGERTGQVRTFTSPETYRGGSIRRADVAAFLLDCAENASFVRETPEVIA